MPMSAAFENRLHPRLAAIAEAFGTPFHIYDEVGIRDTARRINRAFTGIEAFREFFAVKALPNPRVMAILAEEGFGFDCSSVTELILARRVGAGPRDIMFTSNNTSAEDFRVAALDGGCRLNLDDLTLVPKVPRMPAEICFRYNPGARRTGNSIIGNPLEAKYGVAHDQIVDAYRAAMDRGARRFGLHTMVASNERNADYMVQTVAMLLDIAVLVSQALSIRFAFINMGGGLGIPYRPDEATLDLESMAQRILDQLRRFETAQGYAPRLFMESGRFVTGPHGVLVTRAINRKGHLPHLHRRGCLHDGADAPGDVRCLPPHHGAGQGRRRSPPDGGCGGPPVRKQRQVRHPARVAPHRRRGPAGDPRHRRPRPFHGLQLQRPAAAPGAAVAGRRNGGVDPPHRNGGRLLRHPELCANGDQRMKTLHIGRRVEKMLADRQLDITELSRRTGLDLPFLESLLADDVYPSIGPLLKVARALGVRLGTLVDDRISQDPLIVRHSERSAELHMLRAKDRPQTMRFHSLGRGKTDRHMEPFYVELLPESAKAPRLSSHEGEEVGAFIIPKPGADLTAEDVRDFCRGRISRYKIPSHVAFVDRYPLTASGKVQKYKLQEMSRTLLHPAVQGGKSS